MDVSPVWINGDATRIEQILDNLVGNALKYTSAGGRITVRVGADGDAAVLEVADTALATLHGGTVAVRSDGPDKDSVFTVRLPSIRPPAAPQSAATAGTPAPRHHRVLVIEDNDDAREMLGVALRLAGHEVYEAADGEAGVAIANDAAPDTALIDVGLPGLDGYEVARRIRAGANGKSMRLVAVTGYGQAEDRQRALDAGFDAHVTKPVTPERLATVLDQVDRPATQEP